MAAQGGDRKAFHVFSDATLKRIAAAEPTTLGELAAVKGVGPRKLEQYGQGVLGVILRHPTQEGGES
jgi:superfamily II DNA helicase RecQ